MQFTEDNFAAVQNADNFVPRSSIGLDFEKL